MNSNLTSRALLTAIFAALVLAFVATANAAEGVAQPGDPARWYKPDNTPRAHYATAMKEANAALKEALVECRNLAAGQRKGCESQARSVWKDDVAQAKSLISSAPSKG